MAKRLWKSRRTFVVLLLYTKKDIREGILQYSVNFYDVCTSRHFEQAVPATYMILSNWEILQKRNISERKYNCECFQLEIVEHVLKNFTLHLLEREILKNISPKLGLHILLDTKKRFGSGDQVFTLLMVHL